jgi:hypothetical protein
MSLIKKNDVKIGGNVRDICGEEVKGVERNASSILIFFYLQR